MLVKVEKVSPHMRGYTLIYDIGQDGKHVTRHMQGHTPECRYMNHSPRFSLHVRRCIRGSLVMMEKAQVRSAYAGICQAAPET